MKLMIKLLAGIMLALTIFFTQMETTAPVERIYHEEMIHYVYEEDGHRWHCWTHMY